MPFRMTKAHRTMQIPSDEILSDRELTLVSQGSAMKRALKLMRIRNALRKAKIELGSEINWQDLIDVILREKFREKKKRNIIVVSNYKGQ